MANKIEIKVGHLYAEIGELSTSSALTDEPASYVNVRLNFNPIRKTSILMAIDSCIAVDCVINAAYYQKSMGGLGIKLNKDHDVFFLQRCIEQIFNDHLISEQ